MFLLFSIISDLLVWRDFNLLNTVVQVWSENDCVIVFAGLPIPPNPFSRRNAAMEVL